MTTYKAGVSYAAELKNFSSEKFPRLIIFRAGGFFTIGGTSKLYGFTLILQTNYNG